MATPTEPHPIFAHTGATPADKVFRNYNKGEARADERREQD
jgi:hypothetical protein